MTRTRQTVNGDAGPHAAGVAMSTEGRMDYDTWKTTAPDDGMCCPSCGADLEDATEILPDVVAAIVDGEVDGATTEDVEAILSSDGVVLRCPACGDAVPADATVSRREARAEAMEDARIARAEERADMGDVW